MTASGRDPRCEAVQDDLAELALGTLSGVERAATLSHVQWCPECRSEVDRLSSAADAVLLLAPDAEPRPGFETRLFERMGVRQRPRFGLSRRASRLIALAGAALCASLGLGLGLGLGTGGVVASDAPIGADLTADHLTKGEVYLAPGDPGWLFMSVDHLNVTGLVTCRIRTLHGGTATVGTFWLQSGSGSWAYRLPVPANQVASAWITGSGGRVLASATIAR